jgi:hypothetical protein
MTSSGWNRAKYAHFWNQPARPGLMTDVRNAYLALEGEAAKVGLKINEQKTKFMIAALCGPE